MKKATIVWISFVMLIASLCMRLFISSNPHQEGAWFHI